MEVTKKQRPTMASRLGLPTISRSLLLRRLERIMADYPSPGCECLADWLLDLANIRGAAVVSRPGFELERFHAPSEDVLPNEDLVAALCHSLGPDRPQILRAAAQMISRGKLDWERLKRRIEQEYLHPVFAEMAYQALRVEPSHSFWQMIAKEYPKRYAMRGPLIHWNRLAWPVRQERSSCKQEWVLVK